MKQIPLVPRPFSWLSALFLFVFLGLWSTWVMKVLPTIIEIGHESPRLAALGYLGLLMSPIAFVGLGHHAVHAFLDRADRSTDPTRGVLPGIRSLWAGVYAWLVIVMTTAVVVFLMLAMFPPPPDPDSLLLAFAWPFDGRARAGIHTLTWVVVAAQLYDLERAMKVRAKSGDL